MASELIGCRSGRKCLCGALTADGAGTCEKCRFRARWLRRKMQRRFDIG
jgi:hypothetical protein